MTGRVTNRSDTPLGQQAWTIPLALPLAAIVYTDIATDGMLAGPNLAATEQMIQVVDIPVVASGGVTTRQDVERLARIGAAGCIIGRALYEDRITLSAALDAAGDK